MALSYCVQTAFPRRRFAWNLKLLFSVKSKKSVSVALSKTFYPLLNTESREMTDMTETFDWDAMHQQKPIK